MVYTAFILGLFGSLHCVGMCGPITLMLPVSTTNSSQKFLQILEYHLGKTLAYSTLGLVFGLMGRGFYLFASQQRISIIIGVIMILAALLSINRLEKVGLLYPFRKLLLFVKNRLGKLLKDGRSGTLFTIGYLNGFLPCGLVYMAIFGALSMNSPLKGALYMAIFGLGTVPLLTFLLLTSSRLKPAIRLRMRRFVPVAIVLVGILFIIRGMGLDIPYLSPASIPDMVTPPADCH